MEGDFSERSVSGPPLWIVDLGRQPYPSVWKLQRVLVQARSKGDIPDVLLFTEHDPVFTLGRHGGLENLCVPRETLQEKGIPCLSTDRGGDITYHGPGQLVGYPIISIPGRGRRVKAFVDTLEEILVLTLARFGIRAGRVDKNHGVWAGSSKIASIGLAVKNGVSYHGFALNVNMDLAPFSWIHPCGLKDSLTTSMVELIDDPPSPTEVRDTLTGYFSRQMGRTPIPIPADEFSLWQWKTGNLHEDQAPKKTGMAQKENSRRP